MVGELVGEIKRLDKELRVTRNELKETQKQLNIITKSSKYKIAQVSPFNFSKILIKDSVLILCSKFELIPTSIFQVMTIFKNGPKSEKNHCTIAHAFFQKMAKK